MWVHRLTEVNPYKRTAICAYCGVVRITKLKEGYRCGTRSYLDDVRRKYGKTIDTKPTVCEVCGSSKRIVYDHSHLTKKFRGWLCNACNVALGLVKDNPDTLRALALYIEKKHL